MKYTEYNNKPMPHGCQANVRKRHMRGRFLNDDFTNFYKNRIRLTAMIAMPETTPIVAILPFENAVGKSSSTDI